MKYTKYTIETTSQAEDIVSSVIFDNGISGVLIEDKENLSEKELKEMYVDIPINNKSDGKAKISFYINIVDKEQKSEIDKIKFEQEKNKASLDLSYSDNFDNVFLQEEFDSILNNIKQELKEYEDFTNLGSLNITKEELPDIDYMNNWKKFYKPIAIDDVVVKPSFEDDKEEYKNKIVINIEPGQAFGTGSHETTKLCMKAIKKCIKNFNNNVVNFMDIGCGSGILGILAKKLDAKDVVNIDVDDNIKSNIEKNYELNNMTCDKLYFGNIITDKDFRNNQEFYNKDIVVANIISKVIIALILEAKVHEFLKPNAYFITSGILVENIEDVKNAIYKDNHFEIIEDNFDGEWACLIMKKK